MAQYITERGGYLQNAEEMNTCHYCKVKDTNVFLAAISSEYDTRWRNFGIIWVYVVFNIAAALTLYWLARMPKGKKRA
jgi:ABC-type multidrug transport system permease subunit